eukprot:3813214-Rhodomonas_salina.3
MRNSAGGPGRAEHGVRPVVMAEICEALGWVVVQREAGAEETQSTPELRAEMWNVRVWSSEKERQTQT